MTPSTTPAAARVPRTLPTEPVLAVIGLAAVLVGQLLVGAGRLWLLPDVVGGLLAVGAARAIARRRWAGTGPVLFLDAAGLGALSGALALIAVRGPESPIAAMPVLVLSVAGALLTLLVLGTGIRTVVRGPEAGTPDAGTPEAGTPDAGTSGAGTAGAGTGESGASAAADPPGHGLVVLCGAVAAAAVLIVLKDALLR